MLVSACVKISKTYGYNEINKMYASVLLSNDRIPETNGREKTIEHIIAEQSETIY